MRLNEKALGILRKLQAFDKSADKVGADRFYFCLFPKGAMSDEPYSLTGFGFRDDGDKEARRAFLVHLVESLHPILVEEGVVPDRSALLPDGGGEGS